MWNYRARFFGGECRWCWLLLWQPLPRCCRCGYGDFDGARRRALDAATGWSGRPPRAAGAADDMSATIGGSDDGGRHGLSGVRVGEGDVAGAAAISRVAAAAAAGAWRSSGALSRATATASGLALRRSARPSGRASGQRARPGVLGALVGAGDVRPGCGGWRDRRCEPRLDGGGHKS